MGFFYAASKKDTNKSTRKSVIPIESMNLAGCKACSLDTADLKTPKMEPSGSNIPLVYVLGEYPSETDDRKGDPFSGKSGRLLLDNWSTQMQKLVRYNNVIRCNTQDEKGPTTREIECCRGYIEKDIEKSKPMVVVGCGGVPLTWATKLTNVQSFRGRFLPVKIGSHYCWYYCVNHPNWVMKRAGRFGKSEYELVFDQDLKTLEKVVKILAAKGKHPDLPYMQYVEEGYADNIVVIEGNGAEDYEKLSWELGRLLNEPSVGIDWETTGFRPYSEGAKILTAAIGTFDRVIAFPVFHPDGWNSTYQRKVQTLLIEFLLNSGVKVAHHLGFEMEWIAETLDPTLLRKTQWGDTFILEHIIDERRKTHSLGVCTQKYFGFNVKDKSPVDAGKIMQYPLKQVLLYNGMDTKWAHKLYTVLYPLVCRNKNYKKEYERKLRTVPTLVLSQQKGVPLDFDFANKLKDEYDGDIQVLEKKIQRDIAVDKYVRKFGPFNPASPDHVSLLLKDILNRKEGETLDDFGNVTGYSSGEEILSVIPASEVPLAPMILEYRGKVKLLSTYLNPIVNREIVYPDDRMHTTYNLMEAITGRLSSTGPNMQNYPKRKGKIVRNVVRVGDDYILVSADYGQVEARVIGMASEDQKLVDYLWTGYDVHGDWASRVLDYYYPEWADIINLEFNLKDDLKAIKKQCRQEAKNLWVFPQFFGASPYSCARNMRIPEEVSKYMAGDFWEEFNGVKAWQTRLLEDYKKNLYVETLTGRRRRGALSKNEIINSPIQGTASDIVVDAMNRLSEYAMVEEKPHFQASMNIHDDLTFEMPEISIGDDVEFIAQTMCTPTFNFINVPLVVEISAGYSWGSQSEVGVYTSERYGHRRGMVYGS